VSYSSPELSVAINFVHCHDIMENQNVTMQANVICCLHFLFNTCPTCIFL